MKILSVLLLFAALYEINGSRFCGPTLTQVLEMVCYNGYNPMIMSKKSSNKPVHHDMDIPDKFNEIDDVSGLKPDSLLNDLLYGNHVNRLAKTRRHRHLGGVYDECCRKDCTLDELAGYCL
ncbi:probable insulin-like peptide 3 [Stomoxys calcitrans]|uniref:Insulin-like domain-containing protein n=1 Tax=Stomoxys calcitrans TaxID=35570 RepID=A0A1I8P7U9_STOCA|nr:probable insulin-like peptide 3 [Stomoxys calcitrans]